MSEYTHKSFKGGMNLLDDDTRLQPNQYRIGFNVRNRYDVLDSVFASVKDTATPPGIKQEIVTFGNYIILFVAGRAYYRYYTSTGWQRIVGFQMSTNAPRFWTVVVPVAITNYYRLAATVTGGGVNANVEGAASLNVVSGAAAGNLPGLLVQDNVNQPQFIFIGANGQPTSRTTQTYGEWFIAFTSPQNVTVAENGDQREYVPIGNSMAWVDGVLWITSQDRNFLYRSVSGRPLDFVVNVKNTLAIDAPYIQTPGGDATTTSYSVGVGGISCIRPLSSDALFVAASNANFAITKNMGNVATKQFGEYTFIRTFLFNATCLSDRSILDSIGDTRFIDLKGIRSFNAIKQLNTEGRNSQFSANIQSVLSGLVQSAESSAAILYDNNEYYALNTVFGPVIAVYDTLTGSWTSFDIGQAGGKGIKMLAKIELTIQRLYAVTEDDELYTLYSSTTQLPSVIRTCSMIAGNVKTEAGYALPESGELKPTTVRVILNESVANGTISITPIVNNRLTKDGTQTKDIEYTEPNYPSVATNNLTDIDTQLNNVLFSFPNSQQGWKVCYDITWTTGTLTQYHCSFQDQTPMNPLQSQKRIA